MITLRNFKKNDVESLTRHANNENIARSLSHRFPSPFSENDALKWITTGAKNNGIHKAIDLNGECIGSVGITFQPGEHSHCAEIGYWIGEEYWGNGIATDALSQMIDITFVTTNIIRLFAKVFSSNKASMRVLAKCGFKLEGICERAVYKNGQYLDEHIYARIKSSRSH